jgi:hypothetical protein
MRLVRLLALAALIIVPGCGLFSGKGDFGEPDYASEASTNLKRGDEALDGSQYQLADADKGAAVNRCTGCPHTGRRSR